MKKIQGLLFNEDPYLNLEMREEAFDSRGWNGNHPIFEKIIKHLKPQLIVEVGTWKGSSAITMGNCIRDQNLIAEIVCVDTWLGATEFWTNKSDEERYGSLKIKNGLPQVYFTFMNNVLCKNLSDIITPFPATSHVAKNWFVHQKLSPDLVYIDASHEYEEVISDIAGWFKTLRIGGIIIGDDYSTAWPGVIRAVQEFADKNPNFKFLGHQQEKWLAQKI